MKDRKKMTHLQYTYIDNSKNINIEKQLELKNPNSLLSLAENIEKLKVEINDYLTDRVKVEADEKKKKSN
ncbi:hypothetical protein BCR32DRAFT_291914 [Anaeromyces robustus]|uniref:Uncharacterized protein n=1 Tax=Anaeromyces robustus TaxID=1754192 RepID=A0A1Y1XCX8_9FUNG|nr:hypothetical protein BCR32DRAFT_291914 [Anaeromyces robustus]|eukprot:ORX83598.1 hypothetical protein BCR32DRAFT_291914 [Anaeromyces robustus]